MLLLLLALPCAALSPEEALGTDQLAEGLPPDAAAALGDMSPSNVDPEAGLAGIGGLLLDRFEALLAEALRPAAAVLAIVVLCSAFSPAMQPGELNYVELGGSLAVAALGLGDLRSTLALGVQTLETLGDCTRLLLPTLTAAAVSTGAVSSAGAKYAASALFSDLLLTAANGLILPLICGAAAAAAAGAALGTKQLQGAEKLLTWLGKTGRKYLVLAFTFYLGLTGVLRGSADAAAVKAARTALSAGLPVVGKLLADASESLVAGLAMLRSATGVFGLLAVCAAVALPLLRLGLRCLLFRAAAALGGVVAGERLSRLLASLGTVYGMVMGLVGAGAAIALLSIFSLMRTVTG
ncbi:MAG: hypothetical protein IKS66_05370 [Oscillospiraceae bacterium]|nr:hypothetical protein [Oscillospiraceae bacterium]